jgi:isopenicillin N synthase-like dioxygenase/ribosomal protein S18 acetylase RimI-like enzyme
MQDDEMENRESTQIRTVTKGDLDRCFEIETVCYHGHGATRERIERRIDRYPDGFLVAELAGRVVGFINSGCFLQDDIRNEKLKDLEGHDPRGENLVIFSVAVHPDHRRRGFARELLLRFIANARSQRKASILLVCREHLLDFYSRFGFSFRAPSVLTFGGHKWLEMALPLGTSSSTGSTMATRPTSLPLIDLGRLDRAELQLAAHKIGFFYLKGHGVDPALVQRVRSVSRSFFALPESDKLAIEMVNSPHFRGYTRVGREITREKPDWREQLDTGTELPPIAHGPGIPEWVRLVGPNQWPAALPELRETLLQWQAELDRVLRKLLKALAGALDQPENVFDYLTAGKPNNLLKIIRYPGRGGDSEADRQGVGHHKDTGLLTAVLQDATSGLQVQTDQGWVDAEPVDGTFVVNIGELLELATDGYLKATVHRVLSPGPGKERISVAFFLGASFDAVVRPLALSPALAAEAHGPDKDPNNPLFYEVGTNTLKSRLRSHPDVARRHYADLLDRARP